MKFPRRAGRILAAAFALAWTARFSAAAVVEVTAYGVSVHIPGAVGAGAPQMVFSSADVARNLSFQMDRVAAKRPETLSSQLQGALRDQLGAGLPRDEALATQVILTQALLDPGLRTSIEADLRQAAVPRNPELGRETAEKLARAAAAQNEESLAQLRLYTARLNDALASMLAGDDTRFDRLFDGSASRPVSAPAPVAPAGGGRPSSGKIRATLSDSRAHKSAVWTAKLVADNPGQERAAERIASALAGAIDQNAPAAVILLGDRHEEIERMTQAVAGRFLGGYDHISDIDMTRYQGKNTGPAFEDALARAAASSVSRVVRLDNGHLISRAARDVLARAIKAGSLKNSSGLSISLDKTVIFLISTPSDWKRSKASEDPALRSRFQGLAVLAGKEGE